METVIPGMDVSVRGVQAISLTFSGERQHSRWSSRTGSAKSCRWVWTASIVFPSRLGTIGVKGEWLTDHMFRVYVKHIGASQDIRLDLTFNGTILEIIAFRRMMVTSRRSSARRRRSDLDRREYCA